MQAGRRDPDTSFLFWFFSSPVFISYIRYVHRGLSSRFMVMVIYSALVRSHQSTSAGSFGLVRPAWITYTPSLSRLAKCGGIMGRGWGIIEARPRARAEQAAGATFEVTFGPPRLASLHAP